MKGKPTGNYHWRLKFTDFRTGRVWLDEVRFWTKDEARQEILSGRNFDFIAPECGIDVVRMKNRPSK